MSLSEVILIGIILAMDAFGVTLSIGLNSILTYKNKMKFILSFAFFQFLFTYIGGEAGYLFDTYIVNISSLAGGIIIFIVGTLMILDGIKEDKNDILEKNSTCIILGISVSIDALVIGFTTLHNLKNNILFTVDSILIGLITLLICMIGLFLCKYIRRINFVSKYADFLAGIVLILFGLKMVMF
ncbi:manganese efflux pump MntP family protein [Clostridium taeniosporum]|uniref:Manganese efflux pump MntP n=1 Tax=Clostridium taeniosporum TaxID=394958 RepID=A0A1D7XHS2_9CLOT|nr:manganese efflux pump [Clostridium taeniosporum]AOR22862.1 hypothetical protein BGI42_03655 [Clostridium taeniosporum]